MKANELMIGDWVLDGKNIAQIVMITCDGIIETTFNENSNIELIEPIPLTQEILEKNGFENGKFNVSPQYYLEDNDVFIGVTLKDIPDKHKGIDIAKGKLYFQYDISYIEEPIYVHQLQHALRLCGIEKEIIL